jgi:tetratricopeptide (TPR) repeat protein
MRAKGRAQYRKAGQVFGQLAELEFTTRNYPDDVWQSAESYLAGHRFTEAVAALDEYLKYELRRRRPLALVNLGEALLALGRVDDALVALAECIEFYPDDAASFQARLWAARASAEKGDLAAAENLLRENLNGDLLTPESKEWRDSLFALGKLLAGAGRHVAAIERLEEAVSRYPESRQAIEARYLIAEACQQAAKVPQEKAANDTVEAARITHLKQAQQFLETAISYYEQTQEVLNRRQEQTELTALEKSMLRNSYFAAGAALVALGRDEDAIRAYSTATNRYQHDPEVLEAFAQIATCYRRLNKPREARGAVQQAKVVLERIDPNASFAEATIYSRREWKELLDWMGKL